MGVSSDKVLSTFEAPGHVRVSYERCLGGAPRGLASPQRHHHEPTSLGTRQGGASFKREIGSGPVWPGPAGGFERPRDEGRTSGRMVSVAKHKERKENQQRCGRNFKSILA